MKYIMVCLLALIFLLSSCIYYRYDKFTLKPKNISEYIVAQNSIIDLNTLYATQYITVGYRTSGIIFLDRNRVFFCASYDGLSLDEEVLNEIQQFVIPSRGYKTQIGYYKIKDSLLFVEKYVGSNVGHRITHGIIRNDSIFFFKQESRGLFWTNTHDYNDRVYFKSVKANESFIKEIDSLSKIHGL